MLEAGIKGRQEVMVEEGNCASAVGSGLLKVFATPAMIALMEKTAWMSVAPELGEGGGNRGDTFECDARRADPHRDEGVVREHAGGSGRPQAGVQRGGI